jgi:hypothetical protein
MLPMCLSIVFIVKDLSLVGCVAVSLDKVVPDISNSHGTFAFKGFSWTA